jgi:hypothetical protein
MRPWQERALKRGRTPLPESPGQRPWLLQEVSERYSVDREISGAAQQPDQADVPVSNPAPANVSSRSLQAIVNLLNQLSGE